MRFRPSASLCGAGRGRLCRPCTRPLGVIPAERHCSSCFAASVTIAGSCLSRGCRAAGQERRGRLGRSLAGGPHPLASPSRLCASPTAGGAKLHGLLIDRRDPPGDPCVGCSDLVPELLLGGVRLGTVQKKPNVWARRYQVSVAAVAALALVAGPAHGREPEVATAATKPTAAVLRIVFFHSLTCNECRKVKRMLDGILKPWGRRTQVEWKSTGDIQVFRELLLYDEHYCYGVRTKSPPVMFVGRRHLEGERRIYRDLARVVREELAAGAVTYRPPAGPATKGGGDVPEEIVGRFRGFRIAALAAAGLLDGVNQRRGRVMVVCERSLWQRITPCFGLSYPQYEERR